MKRFTASLIAALIVVASGRLLVCDYSCFDHRRVLASSQPSCHEHASGRAPVVVTAVQNDCDDQPAVVTGFFAGKLTSLLKPAPAAHHTADAAALFTTFSRHGQARAPSVLPSLHRITPLRI
jgi:hypothetical protein